AGRPLTGADLPAEAKAAVAQASQTGETSVEHGSTAAFVAQPFRTTDGRSFTVVGQFPTPVGPVAGISRDLTLQILTIVVTAGAVCYALARYLTAPVRRLQSATWRLADGQLDTHVRKRAARRRDELGDLERDFDYMADRIATLMRTQRRLLWDISHELR